VAPVLSGVPLTATIDELAEFTFTAVATDHDEPGQALSYSLADIDPSHVVPPGASIDAGTGVFTWTPSEGQGAGVYQFLVRVSDGAVVHRFPAWPLVLAGEGKVRCQGGLDDIPSGTLGPGSYRVDISVVRDGSDVPVTVARTPIQVD